jgi:hypothetical protein
MNIDQAMYGRGSTREYNLLYQMSRSVLSV